MAPGSECCPRGLQRGADELPGDLLRDLRRGHGGRLARGALTASLRLRERSTRIICLACIEARARFWILNTSKAKTATFPGQHTLKQALDCFTSGAHGSTTRCIASKPRVGLVGVLPHESIRCSASPFIAAQRRRNRKAFPAALPREVVKSPWAGASCRAVSSRRLLGS